ncbi:carboxylesterase/lipase family protein [Mucilaginibacter pocheonensis]|uniref:Carboxylic ester hydrolase n=1 Tax=Mucilaginibacter pocheonensis TaxID=398050 RepID=A0ABU1TE80_9SPHI|nr:carboxylesterase family protein [Mucilaginibacter pocheonensis]MDR6943556.1 para-nitrobenzyl esterase [Mucilaginibacter pocheonensis]
MKKTLIAVLLLTQIITLKAFCQINDRVNIENGVVEGTRESGSPILIFKGIPYAQPPVGDLRWKEPQPAKNWEGVLKADHFGHNAMQKPIFGDMNFRSSGMSEDCLYLNVWTPAKTGKEKLPVLVYFYGGGLAAGDGSEPRYDGESMAKKGIVALTVNYRLGIFGFFSHPELTKESPNHSSGNYGYLDQHAALVWVQKNIAAFGGDPKRVTIAGESAGSISVSVQMASPLSKDLIAGAIGESGAAIKPTLYPIPLAEAEKNGAALAARLNAGSLAALRALPASQLLDSVFRAGAPATSATIDGYLLPKSIPDIFKAGEQAHVPLLVGWNSAEVPYQFVLRADAPTPENYSKAVKQLYGDRAEEVQKLYPASTNEEVIKSATALSSDRFIVYSTWKWADLQVQTGGKPVYRYEFSRIRPAMTAQMGNATPGLAGGVVKNDGAKPAPPAPAAVGASHASEIEYAMGNLASNKVYAWTPEDYKVSATMENYFANFIKTGNPNGSGLPKWEAITDNNNAKFMNIDVKSQLKPEVNRARYLFLDKEYMK